MRQLYTDSQIMAIIKQNEQGVAVNELCREHGMSYQAKLSTENQVLADWLLRLTTANKRWGFGVCFFADKAQAPNQAW